MDTSKFEAEVMAYIKWLRNAVLGLNLAVILVVGLLVYGFIKTSDLAHQQGRDEHVTCLIQQGGLPAAQHLRLFLIDLADAENLVSAKNKKLLAKLPPKQRAVEKDMLDQLFAYASAEKKQPTHRSC